MIRKDCLGGQYKVEALLSRTDEDKLSTDSMTWQLPKLIDRAEEITITSPTSQTLNEALRIEGAMIKAGDRGVEIEVRGPDGVVFGPGGSIQNFFLRMDRENSHIGLLLRIPVTTMCRSGIQKAMLE